MFKKALLVATSLVASSSVFAQEAGSSAVSSTLAEFTARMTGDLTTVGIAMITLAAVAVGFKWVKGAIFN